LVLQDLEEMMAVQDQLVLLDPKAHVAPVDQ